MRVRLDAYRLYHVRQVNHHTGIHATAVCLKVAIAKNSKLRVHGPNVNSRFFVNFITPSQFEDGLSGGMQPITLLIRDWPSWHANRRRGDEVRHTHRWRCYAIAIVRSGTPIAYAAYAMTLLRCKKKHDAHRHGQNIEKDTNGDEREHSHVMHILIST